MKYSLSRLNTMNHSNIIMSKIKTDETVSRYDNSNTNVSASTMTLMLFFFYTIYGKCLHLLFRHMRYPVVARRRIIDGSWCTGFALGSILYLKYLVPRSLDTACISQKPEHLELGFLLQKSFYLHRSFIEVFFHGSWLQGSTNLLFCMIIHGLSEQKWFDIITKLLFYKASVTAIINSCRVLLTVKKIKHRVLLIKILLTMYAISWVHVPSVIVPDFQWWNTQGLKNDWLTMICMWTWLMMEFLNEIMHIRTSYCSSVQRTEAYLFPAPTEEMIVLKNICEKLHEPSDTKNAGTRDSKKVTDLWQTMTCAMILKRKIKKLRETKKYSASINDTS